MTTLSTRVTGDPEIPNYYHVMSRTVSDAVKDEEGRHSGRGMFFFAGHEKNVFAKQLRRYAEFTGVEVLTWCMMDNHFHLLVRVPARSEYLESLLANGREKFWKRLRVLYSRGRVKAIRKEVSELESRGGMEHRVDEIIASFTRRMGDLSMFVLELKRCFSVWFNQQYERRGTVWMERYKSVLLEGDPEVLNKVAAYIDLNPVRAGIVEDPGDYHWSGYGQAVGGEAEARRGLSAVYGYDRGAWKQMAAKYRVLLFREGIEIRDEEGIVVRMGISKEDFYREMSEHGEEKAPRRFVRRVRYFTDGAAVGGREFLESVFQRNRGKFGSKRKTGARKFRGKEWKGAGMYSLRDLVRRS